MCSSPAADTEYCQLGEGNCFLRVPPHTHMRPVLTGWFAAFEALDDPAAGTSCTGKALAAFGGATYDVTSHYRAAAVFAFHERHGLTPTDFERSATIRSVLLKT